MQEFAEQAETIFKSSDRRGDLDKAYLRLFTSICAGISRVANDHPKTPKDVVNFGMSLFLPSDFAEGLIH